MTDRGWTDMFGALREREFDRLLTGQVFSTTVSDVLGVTQTLWVSAATILVLVLVGLSVPCMRNLPSWAAEAGATSPAVNADVRRAEG